MSPDSLQFGRRALGGMLIPQLQARSAWAWPQAIVWAGLGGALLNLPVPAAALVGLVGYVTVACAAQLSVVLNGVARWRAIVAGVKLTLGAISLCVCAMAALKPATMTQGAALGFLFRPSAAFPETTFYGGWPGEPIIIAVLILLALGQAVLNELNFQADFLGGKRLDMARLGNRKAMFSLLVASLVVISVALTILLLAGMGGDTGPRGHIFDARLGPVWAFAWWAILSFVLLFLRFVRLASVGLTSQRHVDPT